MCCSNDDLEMQYDEYGNFNHQEKCLKCGTIISFGQKDVATQCDFLEMMKILESKEPVTKPWHFINPPGYAPFIPMDVEKIKNDATGERRSL